MSRYVEILFRHRLRFFILLAVLPVTLAMACVVVFPHQTAVSSMWADTPAYIPISSAASGWNQYLTPAQNTADALNQLRSTDSFVHDLAVKLDAGNTFRDESERDSVLGSVTGDVSVLPAGSHLVILTYTCPRAAVCTSVLAGIEAEYHDWLTSQQSAQAALAINFYTGQLAAAQKQLSSDSAALSAYIAAHPGVLRPNSVQVDAQFDGLLRQVDTDRAAVSDLQQKLDSTKLQDAAINQTDSTVLRVVDPPRVTGGTLSALPKKQMAAAAIGAFLLGIGVLVFMAWSDRTTREPEELEKILHLPVVVTVPDLAVMGAGGDG